MNRSELRASVKAWIKTKNQSARLPDEVIDDLIQLTLDNVYTGNHLRFTETSTSEQLSAQSLGTNVPERFIRPIALRWKTGLLDETTEATRLNPLDKREFDRRYPKGGLYDRPLGFGEPIHFQIYGDSILLGPRPDQDGVFSMDFDQLPEDLESDDVDVPILAVAWDCILFGTLYNATHYVIEDSRANVWLAKYTEAQKALNIEHMIARRAGGRHVTSEPH